MRQSGFGADSLRPLSRVRCPRQHTVSEEFKAQLNYDFQHLYTTLQETKDEFHIATASFADGAWEAYAFLQLIEGSLARDEKIVDADSEQGRKSLQVVESEAKQKQEQYKIQVEKAFRFQQTQRELNIQGSEISDRILEGEVVVLRAKLERQEVE